MINRLAMAAALSVLLSGAALAQSAPTAPAPSAPAPSAQPTTDAMPSTADACIAAAVALGQAAEIKTFGEEKLDKLDQLFSKMESFCDNKQFTEAMAVAKDIRSVIDGN